MVKTYRKNSPVTLSAYFKTTEFDCQGKGCCSETHIDTELVNVLIKVRQRFGPVIITSGYRCKQHNAEVGGASASKHTLGYAADIKVKNSNGEYVDPLKVAWFIDSLYNNTYGIEVGSYDSSTGGYVHIDTRPVKWRALRTNSSTSKYTTYATLTPTVKMGSSEAAVLILGRKLKGLGYYTKSLSNTFGAELQAAVINFQRAKGLTTDGIAGPKTWKKIMDLL